jgi:hypothetical protein
MLHVNGTTVHIILGNMYRTVSDVHFTNDGEYLISGGFDRMVRVSWTGHDKIGLLVSSFFHCICFRSGMSIMPKKCAVLVSFEVELNERQRLHHVRQTYWSRHALSNSSETASTSDICLRWWSMVGGNMTFVICIYLLVIQYLHNLTYGAAVVYFYIPLTVNR